MKVHGPIEALELRDESCFLLRRSPWMKVHGPIEARPAKPTALTANGLTVDESSRTH